MGILNSLFIKYNTSLHQPQITYVHLSQIQILLSTNLYQHPVPKKYVKLV